MVALHTCNTTLSKLVSVKSCIETRQRKATTPEDGSFFSREKIGCL